MVLFCNQQESVFFDFDKINACSIDLDVNQNAAMIAVFNDQHRVFQRCSF